MNNRGQVLIIFIIMLPIFLIILTFIIDLGLLSLEKRKVNNNTYDALEFYLDNSDNPNIKDKTVKLVESNLDDININIIENNEYIEITVKKEYKGLYNKLYDNEIIITYKGVKENKKIIKG